MPYMKLRHSYLSNIIQLYHCELILLDFLFPRFQQIYMEQGADDYEYIYGLGPDQPPTGVLVKPELRRKVLYNMSPTEVSICSIYISQQN